MLGGECIVGGAFADAPTWQEQQWLQPRSVANGKRVDRRPVAANGNAFHSIPLGLVFFFSSSCPHDSCPTAFHLPCDDSQWLAPLQARR
jgi:hypothetical protein